MIVVGVMFVNFEDESGLVNVVCLMGVWNCYCWVVCELLVFIICGILERLVEGVVNVFVDGFEDLCMGFVYCFRDFC